MRTGFGWRGYRQGLTWPLIALCAIVAGVGAGILGVVAWGGRNGDDVSIRRATFVINTGIDAFVTRAAREHLAAWSAVPTLRDVRPDAVAHALIEAFDHDVVRVELDGASAMERLGEGDGQAAADLTKTVASLAVDGPGYEAHNRRRASVDGGHGGGPHAVVRANLISLDGRPAVAVVSWRRADGASVRSIRRFDGGFLAALSRDYAVDAPRLSRINNAQWPETTLPIIADNGDTAGFFIWSPKRAGTEIMGTVLPIVAVGVVLVFCLSVWLVLGLARRNTALATGVAHARYLALHDELTGLPNRRAFGQDLDTEIARVIAGRLPISIALIDIDRFKDVNDTLGHPAGDALVRSVAERISATLAGRGIAYRLGGDEFAIILPGVADETALVALIDRLAEATRVAFDLDGQAVHVTLSIGLAIATPPPIDAATFVRQADIALNRAKDEGRNRHAVFNESMDDAVKLRRTMELELRDAIAAGQLELHYQMLMHHDGKRACGVEALVRWRHPTKGMVSPAVFLPVAEQTGLIVDVGFFVMAQAFRDAPRFEGLSVAVNLSAIQFRYPDFLARVENLVAGSGVDPTLIEFEVTESVLIDETGRAKTVLAALRAMGFRIALDDFGTGYSSLGYLRRFEVNKIKIDQSFVRSLETSVEATAIVHAVIGLAKALRLQVTAEGVETEPQHRFLQAAGCDQMQGYLFARPEPIDTVIEKLHAAETQRASAA